MTVGERLRNLRKSKGMTQRQLAGQIGCSHQTISKYEDGNTLWKLETISQLCEFFNVSTDYLVNGSAPKNKNPLSDEDYSILERYKCLSASDKRVVDFILDSTENKKNFSENKKQQTIYRLPIYRQDVAAGSGQFGIEQVPNYEDFQLDDIPNNISYGVRIKGNSMETDDENNIPDKSIVLISTNFNQNELEKEAVVANINGILVCKEYNIAEDDKHIWLKSRNRKQAGDDKYIYDMNGIKILGKVVKVIV